MTIPLAAHLRQLARLVLGNQRIDQLVQTDAFHDLVQLVERQVDPVIGDTALRKVVRPDPLGAIPAADLVTPLICALLRRLLPFHLVDPRPQHIHRQTPVLVLRFLR